MRDHKYLHFLMMVYITFILASDVLVYKLVSIGSITETGAALVFPATYVIADIIAEIYGYKISRQLVWYVLVCDLLFCGLVTLVVYLPSPAHWALQQSYVNVLGKLMRLEVSGSVAFLVGGLANIYLMSKWKMIAGGKMFWLRSLGSSAIGEAALTLCGYTIAFIGKMPYEKILSLMLAAWVFKVLYTIVLVYPATIIVRLLKRAEGMEHHVSRVNFNPFKVEDQ